MNAVLNLSGFASPQSNNHCISTRDLGEAYEYISAHIVDYKCHCTDRSWHSAAALYHNHANINDLELLYINYGREVEISTAPLDDIYILQVAEQGHCLIQCEGREVNVTDNQWCLISPGSSYHMKWSRDCGLFELKIPKLTLDRIFQSFTGIGTDKLIKFENCFNSESFLINHLSSIFSYLCQAAESPAIKQQNVASLSHVEEMLVTMILENQRSSHSGFFSQEQSKLQLPRHLVRAVDYMQNHMSEPLTLAAVASEAGTSMRNLNFAFRRFFDCSPMEYLKHIRLEYAHAALKRGTRFEAKIANVAMDCGFRHMGRFASEYFKRFGEYPRQSRAQTVKLK